MRCSADAAARAPSKGGEWMEECRYLHNGAKVAQSGQQKKGGRGPLGSAGIKSATGTSSTSRGLGTPFRRVVDVNER